MSGKKSITDIEYSYSIWSTGGTVLAQGCLQLAPPEHFYRQLWAFGSGTASSQLQVSATLKKRPNGIEL